MLRPALLLTALLVAGCVERTERLTIDADGSVAMALTFESDSLDELYAGDATPAIDQGWLVTEHGAIDAEGHDRFTLEARASFAPDEPLPERYGPLADPLAEVVLHFATTLTIEARPDGTYYHFRRAYPARGWADVDLPRQALHKEIDELVSGRPLEKLTKDERARLVRDLARVEVLQFSTFARRAFTEVSPDAPQDLWLVVRAAAQDASERLDEDALAELLSRERQEDPLAPEQLQRATAEFRASLLEAAVQVLRPSGWYSSARLSAFKQCFQQHQSAFEITGDLGDDALKVIVEMPGELVGSNADSASGATVTWQLNGQMMRDRQVELLATSRVP